MAKNLHLVLFTSLFFALPIMQAQSLGNEDKLWDSEKLYVSTIYPNPAVDVITLDYRLLDFNTKASIVVRNVIGSEMGIFHLNSTETNVVMPLDNFSSGIYFYTLQIDGQEMVTKKFMVNK